jgi:hypothetical protein
MASQFFVPCIFCGGKGVSKEHIFPQWMQGIVPPQMQRTVHLVDGMHAFGWQSGQKSFSELGALARPGDPLSQTINKVCRTCNNGWMSRIVEDAKPLLADLLSGRIIPLSRHDRMRLVRAVILTAMMIDQADERLSAVSSEARRHIMTAKTPPANWRVFFAWNEGQMHAAWWNRTFVASVQGVVPSTSNFNVCLWYVGKAIFLVLGEHSGLNKTQLAKPPKGLFTELWPKNRMRHGVATKPMVRFDVPDLIVQLSADLTGIHSPIPAKDVRDYKKPRNEARSARVLGLGD